MFHIVNRFPLSEVSNYNLQFQYKRHNLSTENKTIQQINHQPTTLIMDSDKLTNVLQSLDTQTNIQSPKVSSSISRKYKISKPKHEHHHHPTISYFRSISSRRVHTPEPETPKSSSTTFQPYNRDQLLLRIQSFQNSTNWGCTRLKIPLTPLDISRNGWSCHPKNEIRCSSCHSSIHIKFPDEEMFKKVNDEGEDEYDEEYHQVVLDKLCEKYKEELINSHGKNCPWRKIQTPLNCYGLIIDGAYLQQFKNQVEAMEGLEIRTKSIEGEETLIQWCNENSVGYDNIDTLRIVLLGWKVVHLHNNIIYNCESCGRRFMNTDEKINLLDQHNDWCCYINGHTKVIEFMKSILKKQEDNEQSDDNDIETLQRLDKLRKIIF